MPVIGVFEPTKQCNLIGNGRGTRLALLAQNKIYDVLSMFNDNLFALNY